jgi:hypothetical protein
VGRGVYISNISQAAFKGGRRNINKKKTQEIYAYENEDLYYYYYGRDFNSGPGTAAVTAKNN